MTGSLVGGWAPEPAETLEGDPLTDVFAQVEIAGALEGLSARWAAERGTSSAQLKALRLQLSEIEDMLRETSLSPSALTRFASLNSAFHRAVVALAPSATLRGHTGERTVDVFSLPEMRRLLETNHGQISALLLIEQDEHHRILDAIEEGLGAHAESLVRDHALLFRRHLSARVSA